MHKKYYFTVDIDEEGERIDNFLKKKLINSNKDLKSISRSQIQNNLSSIKVNNKNIKKNYKLKRCDKIIYTHKELCKSNKIIKENLPINIIYEDNEIIIINKEKGVLVHPSNIDFKGTLLNIIIDKLDKDLLKKLPEEENNKNYNIRPGIVHRIDKDCSGLVIIAKKKISEKRLIESFKKRQINKEYYAIVKGNIKEKGKWESGIGRDPKNRKKYTSNKNAINPKSAISLFETIKRYNIKDILYTMIKIKIITGRTHQIRVHCKDSGHPIIGDIIYSKQKNKIENMGLALCAKKLEFKHPVNNKKMKFEIDLPKHFNKIIAVLERATKL